MDSRIPERFEKHNGYWWIMGIEKFHVNSEPHYCLGPYMKEKDARQEWRDLLRNKTYDRTVYPCPVTYSPFEPERVIHRAERARGRYVGNLPVRKSRVAKSKTASALVRNRKGALVEDICDRESDAGTRDGYPKASGSDRVVSHS